jgi:hypothetical protein
VRDLWPALLFLCAEPHIAGKKNQPKKKIKYDKPTSKKNKVKALKNRSIKTRIYQRGTQSERLEKALDDLVVVLNLTY